MLKTHNIAEQEQHKRKTNYHRGWQTTGMSFEVEGWMTKLKNNTKNFTIEKKLVDF